VKFIRDVRDDPEPPKPPNPRAMRFHATFVVGSVVFVQAMGRSIVAGVYDTSPLVIACLLFALILPVPLTIDFVRHWRLLRLLRQLDRLSGLEIRSSRQSPSDCRGIDAPFDEGTPYRRG
jgi:hypothetical protein